MEVQDFLTAVLPTSGKYCTFTSAEGRPRNFFSQDTSALENRTLQISNSGAEAWFALATFKDSNRKVENVVKLKSLFVDLDCGVGANGKAKAFSTKKAAVAALIAFTHTVGLASLGDPWIVDSGGGVHAYWPLTEEVNYGDWKPVAEALKRAAQANSFPIDYTVTGDAARVLRLPGTQNHKYDPPRPVVLRNAGGFFDLAAVYEVLKPYALPVAPLRTELALMGDAPVGKSAVMDAFEPDPLRQTRFRPLLEAVGTPKACKQLEFYVQHAADDGMEPLWRGMLSWCKPCVDGPKAARYISGLHPYDPVRTQQKLDSIKGPYSCATMEQINPGGCEGCVHRGKITNPLVMGRETVRETTEDAQKFVDPAAGLNRPPCPEPFFYAKDGSIFVRKTVGKGDDKETIEIAVLDYPMYVNRMFRDGMDYCAEIKAHKGESIITFALPCGAAATGQKTIEVLAKNNIFAAGGSQNDQYLFGYVRACVQARSVVEDTVVIPPTFGWQEDGSFALHDMVFSPEGKDKDYTYASDRLHNLVSATQAKGTLEGWQATFHMLRKKKMWGHLAYAMSGFGSILMQFMPSNSRACVLHMCGTASSAGKSLSLSLNSSIWGPHERYKVKAKTSETTMMQRAGLWRSLPLNVDEVTEKQRDSKGEFIPNLAFSFSEGSHKIKGSANGNVEISHELLWASKMHITSNSPAFEGMLGARDVSSHGEARRMLEWVLSDSDVIQWTPEERAILADMDNHYGHAGRKFAEWCTRNRALVQEVCAVMLDHWREFASATDDERFWTASIAADMAAILLCSAGKRDAAGNIVTPYANVIDIPVGPIRSFWLARVQEQRRIIAQNNITALDMLNAYIRENMGGFVHFADNQAASMAAFGGPREMPRSAIRGRVETNSAMETVDVIIEERVLRQYCAFAGRSYKQFVDELSKAGIVTYGSRNLMRGFAAPTLSVKCLIMRRRTADVEDGNII